MYYEFYIDVFFVVNLLLDFFALSLTGRILGGTAKPFRAFLGAALGAGGICGFFLFFREIGAGGAVFFFFASSFVMTLAAFGFQTLRKLILANVVFSGVSFLLGGTLNAIPGKWRGDLLTFFTVTITAYWILNIGIRLFKYLKGKDGVRFRVILELEDRKIKLEGLRDTGNCLADQSTGKPVSVVEYSCFEKLLGEEQKRALKDFCSLKGTGEEESLERLKPRFLLYSSVGQEGGLLPVVTIDRAIIFQTEERRLVYEPAIGLTQTGLSLRGDFQIILSPKLWEN